MGGTTITIQKDKLIEAIDELAKQRKEIEETHFLYLNSITILGKSEDEYFAVGDKGIEAKIGINYPTEKLEKNIVIFAHFGK